MFGLLRPRLRILVGLLTALGLCFALIGSARAEVPHLPDLPADQVVVKLKAGVSINAILARYNASLLDTLAETNLYFLQLPAGQTAAQVLPALNADSDLHYAEPNYYTDGLPGGGHIMFDAHMLPLAGHIMFDAHGGLTATPPAGSTQWAWSKIGLAEAQKISRGQGVIVAVLDTGMAPDHPLLNSSIIAGYDFVGMRNDIYDHGNGLDDTGNGEVDEFVGHGTHVSGIIVTEAPGVQIMPIRVLNSDGVGTYWEVAAGIRYAVDHGARIINMSLSAPRLTPSLAGALDYAAARGVIVIAAAGTGTGPNYPAGYSNPLGVIGVGASDPSDGIPWFSGGQLSDTDVYAPGVDIYSAYPYNGYGLGSGTSMSAPIVAGEAALLMSRYPDWTSTQIIQRILSRTNPVAGGAVGRVNLSSALNTGLEARYLAGDFGSPNDNSLKPHIRLVNNTPEDIPLGELKVRYWYTIDSDKSQSFNCDHSTHVAGCGGLAGSFTRLPAGHVNRNSLSDTYLEVGFSGGSGSFTAGSQFEMYLRVNKADWSNYAEGNDYSYDGTRTVFTRWDHITIYRNGNLIWGLEPAGGQSSTATLTRTPTQAAASPTRTNTALPAATATRTPTQVAATKTATPAAPTATRTPTASGSTTIKLQYKAGNTAGNSQAISPHVILFNTGSANIPLSELRIRYWFTVDGSQPQSYWCDYAALNCANVTAQFVALPTARPGADYYLEIGFTTGAGSLAPGANTGQIQNRFSKNDWSPYIQTGDYSFDASKIQFVDWNRVTVYRNGVLVWGIEP